MATPLGQVAYLLSIGAAQPSGKAFGGKGRSTLTLDGQRYVYDPAKPLTKKLAAVVSAAYAKSPTVLDDLLSPDAGDGSNVKPSRAARRQRFDEERARRKAEVAARNAYVHELVEGLRSLGRGESDAVGVDLRRISSKAFYKLLVANVSLDRRLALKLPGYKFYFLNDRTLDRLAHGLVDENALTGGSSSDGELTALENFVDNFEVVVVKEGRKRAAGAFFRFTHKLAGLDLSRWGVFTEVDPKNYEDCCLWLALQAAGLPAEQLEQLKLFLANRYIPKMRLKEICAALGIAVRLKTLRADGDSRQETFGEKGAPLYHVGLYEEHYFAIEKVPVAAYALENFDTVKDLPDWHKIYTADKKRVKRSADRFVDSFRLFQMLLANKESLLDPIVYSDAIQASAFYSKIHEFGSLEYDPAQNTRLKTYEPRKGHQPFIVYFDFETTTDGDAHAPYLVCFETEDGERGEFFGENCAELLLKDLVRVAGVRQNEIDRQAAGEGAKPHKIELLLLAHNSNYDCRFLLRHIDDQRLIDKSGRFLSISGTFTNRETGQKINFAIRDSQRMLDMALAKFGKTFGLDVAKEILPYSLYRTDTVCKDRVPLEEAKKRVAKENRTQFLENAEAWGCLDGHGGFFHLRYSAHYCAMDCEVLRKGYETFRGWLLEATGLDPVQYITLQSLAADYFVKEGCYEDVPQLSGVPQAFISKCIVGGRCMANSNKKWHVGSLEKVSASKRRAKRRGKKFAEKEWFIADKIADFDACALYPSAMKRLGGYLKGPPKVLGEDQLGYDFLQRCDGYFVKVRVSRVRRRRQFPLASVVSPETGTRDWTNELEGQELFLDKTGLEDLIRFQRVQFEVLQGYYFDEGRNDRLGAVIQRIYDLRRKLKREGNKAQEVFKLLMNSAYGRSILRPIETDTVVVPEERFEGFVSMNYLWLETAQKVGDKFYVKKTRPVHQHWNHAQCGVEVLSTSKRIMNEVMCLAEDEGHTIFYQDTDSMHIPYEAVPKLAEAFQREYCRELIGEGMGQFHVDFALEGAATGAEIFATECFFLGKKCYFDALQSEDKKGQPISGEHIRMKGVPNPSILHTAKTEGISVLELYERLFDGEAFSFDLTCGGSMCGFKYNRDLSVRSYRASEFVRTVRFAKGGEEDAEPEIDEEWGA